jgi:hypothetical protein
MLEKELYMVFVPGISWILFALGGTQISDKIPGWKGWRRFILPAVYVGACMLGFVWWRALLVGLIAFGVYTMPYGDKLGWWGKFLVGLCYGMISLPIGLSWWNLFTAAGFIIVFALSNTKLTERVFVWSICEGIFGCLVGIQVAYKLLGL